MNTQVQFHPLKLLNEEKKNDFYPEITRVAEGIILPLGFVYSHTTIQPNIYSQYDVISKVYYNPELRVFVDIIPRMLIINPFPFHLAFISYLSDGRIIATTDGLKGLSLESDPSAIVVDEFSGDPIRQLQLHKQTVENNIKTGNATVLSNTPEERLIAEEHSQQKDIIFREKKYFKKDKTGLYRYRALSAFQLATTMIKALALRAKKLKTAAQDIQKNIEADIEADIYLFDKSESDKSNPPSRKSPYLLLTSASVVLFIVAFGLFFSWDFAFLVLAVVAIHELGHWAGMKIFGYKDAKIFFVPLFGGFTTGLKDEATPYQKLIILLLGPVPGLIIGAVALVLYSSILNPILVKAGTLFIIINYINLLPITPFDGGKIVDTFIRHKHPLASFLFTIISTVALIIGAILLKEPFLAVIGVIMSITIKSSWTTYKAIRYMQTQQPDRSDSKLLIRYIITATYRQPFADIKPNDRFSLIKSLYSYFQSPVPSGNAAIIGGLCYCFSLIAPIFIGLLVFMAQFLGLFFNPPVTDTNFIRKLENATSTKERRDIYLQMGNWYYYSELPDSALTYYRLALQTSDSIHLNDDSHYWILLGLFRSTKDTTQQREYFQEALKTLETTDQSQHSKIIELLVEYASNDLSNISENEKLQYLQRALEMSRFIQIKSQESDVLFQLSHFYERKKNIALAETLLVQSMHLVDDGPYAQAHNAQALADFYSRTGRDSLGLLVLDRQEKNIDTLDPFISKMFCAELYAHQGWIALKQNDTALARNYFNSAHNIWIKEKEDFYSYYQARNSLDLCYILLKSGQIEEARKEFLRLQSDARPEIMNMLVKMTSKMQNYNKYYMDWEYRRQEAHSYVFNALKRPDSKTGDR